MSCVKSNDQFAHLILFDANNVVLLLSSVITCVRFLRLLIGNGVDERDH